MVQYQVQYKPIHPKTLSSITNTTLENFVQDTASTLTTQMDPKYDMIFYCDTPKTGSAPKDLFKRLEGDTWVVHSIVHSLKAATAIAKKLVSTYGINTVQICKITPIATDIVFEER